MSRRVEVAVRVRPISVADRSGGDDCCVDVDGSAKGGPIICVGEDVADVGVTNVRRFKQDCIFPPLCTNRDVYDQVISSRIRAATPSHPDTLCVLAYGHTSSGKTHTIAGDGDEAGVLTMCVEELLRRDGAVEVSMLEVYADKIYDLLARGEQRTLRRRSGPRGTSVVVEKLVACVVSNVQQWEAISLFGMLSRRTASTEYNRRSSRSHALFTLKSSGVRVCLVDLAGSERQTIFSPQLTKESIAINTSLSRLSTVLQALSQQPRHDEDDVGNDDDDDDGGSTTRHRRRQQQQPFVSFRDSTLTALLQRYLCGASRTTFLACVHPSSSCIKETVSTLRYTQRLKKLRTHVPVAGLDDISIIRSTENQALMEEMMKLREKVAGTYTNAQAMDCDYRCEMEALTQRLRKEAAAAAALAASSSPTPTSAGTTNKQRTKDAFCMSGREKELRVRAECAERMAKWLLGRVMGRAPFVNVGYDEYFEELFPSHDVVVVGYATSMLCLPPQLPPLETLAVMKAGSMELGFAIASVGVPAHVPMYRGANIANFIARCVEAPTHTTMTMMKEEEEEREVMALALFAVDAAQTNTPRDDDVDGDAAFSSDVPLMPLAVIMCATTRASPAQKEAALEQLGHLFSRQAGAESLSMNDDDDDDDRGTDTQSIMDPEEVEEMQCHKTPTSSRADHRIIELSAEKEQLPKSPSPTFPAIRRFASSSDDSSSEEVLDANTIHINDTNATSNNNNKKRSVSTEEDDVRANSPNNAQATHDAGPSIAAPHATAAADHDDDDDRDDEDQGTAVVCKAAEEDATTPPANTTSEAAGAESAYDTAANADAVLADAESVGAASPIAVPRELVQQPAPPHNTTTIKAEHVQEEVEVPPVAADVGVHHPPIPKEPSIADAKEEDYDESSYSTSWVTSNSKSSSRVAKNPPRGAASPPTVADVAPPTSSAMPPATATAPSPELRYTARDTCEVCNCCVM